MATNNNQLPIKKQASMPTVKPGWLSTKQPLMLPSPQQMRQAVTSTVKAISDKGVNLENLKNVAASIPNTITGKGVSHAKRKHAGLKFLIFLLILIIIGTAGWYIWSRVKPVSLTSQTAAGMKEQFYPSQYRASTIPFGSLTLGGTVSLRANLLTIQPGGKYTLGLVNLANPDQWDAAALDSVQALGSFSETDGSGVPKNFDGTAATFTAPADSAQYNAVVVLSQSAADRASAPSAVILLGKVDPAGGKIALEFPYGLTTASGGSVFKTTSDQGNIITVNFTGLPNLSDAGLIYEARLAQFDGPSVVDELVVGKLQGSEQKTSFMAEMPSNIARFSHLVISIRPLWDTNNAIGQIKPFVFVLQ